MYSYLAFIHGGIEAGRTGSPDAAIKDGVELAQKCIVQLDQLDLEHFPPKLLILLASPAYLEGRRAAQLLEGVYSTFEDADLRNVPLIGSSVAAVFFDGAVHQSGALLVCLASRLLTEVEVAFSRVVAGDPPEKPVKELLEQLSLDSEAGEDPNPFANRALFTFMPGNTRQGYVAGDLHESLRERVWARVPIIGGVSSGFDGESYLQPVQFTNRQAHKNFMVAARITSGAPLGMSANVRLDSARRVVTVTDLDDDGVTLRGLDCRPVPEVLDELRAEHGFILFGKSAYNSDPFVEHPGNGHGAVRLLKRVQKGDAFTVLRLVPEGLAASVSAGIKRSCKSIGLINAVGCLGFRCSSYLRHGSQLRLDLHEEIARIENELSIQGHYVGGFVDGEAGKDRQGRSVLRSWSTAAVVFGDELRPRTVVNDGFFKIAAFLSHYPQRTGPHEQSVRALLEMIYDIGFPGVRLLLVLADDASGSLVVPDSDYAAGSLGAPHCGPLPFAIKLPGKDQTSDEPAARAASTGRFQFTAYSEAGDPPTSHFFTPLKNSRHEVVAVIQIDLGRKSELRAVEERLLSQLAIIVGASLSRVFNSQEVEIRTKLQEALRRYLSASDTTEGVQNYMAEAIKALGLEMGHVRQLKDYCLELYGGAGPYYTAARLIRPSISSRDSSPTMKAFNSRNNIIVNDARNSIDHLNLMEQYSGDSSEDTQQFFQLLDSVRSYTNIYFESGRDIKGTINLVSQQPWFFKHPQLRVLPNIAEHVEFLIDHLEQKSAEALANVEKDQALDEAKQARVEAEKQREEAEQARSHAEQINRRLRFVIDATPQIAKQNLDNFRGTLNGLLSLFCEKAMAQVGSLYLWDQDRELYVLRAAYRWKDRSWVDAAAYSKDDGWFGARDLMGEPRHFPNLNRYYESKGYRSPEKTLSRRGGTYARFMFDHQLSDNFQVEVIGLPLSIGQGNEIGVLALYRRVRKDEKSGFLKTIIDAIRNSEDRQLITGTANEIAGLIGALLQRHDDKTESAELKRRKRISNALSNYIEEESDGSDELFESLVCRTVAQEYWAASAVLYSVEPARGGGGAKVIPRASYPPGAMPRRLVAVTPDPYVRAALEGYTAKAADDGTEAEDVYVKRKSLSPEERDDPYKAATEGLVERACLPLLRGPELTEVLDLRWKTATRQSYEEETHFRKKYLWQLSEDLSMFSRLHKQTVKRIEAEKNQKLFMGKVGAVAQAAHTWRRRFRDVFYEGPEGARRMPADPRERVEYLEGELQVFQREMDELLNLTERTDLEPRPVPLLDLIKVEKRPGDETVIVSKRIKERNEIKCDVRIPADLTVNVTPGLVRFAFENVIDNAIDATQNLNDGFLTITVECPTPKLVQVTFSNNGERISPERRDAVNSNHFKELRQSWGLMIAKCFAVCHGGDLDIQTPPEGGTASIFTLPVAQ